MVCVFVTQRVRQFLILLSPPILFIRRQDIVHACLVFIRPCVNIPIHDSFDDYTPGGGWSVATEVAMAQSLSSADESIVETA